MSKDFSMLPSVRFNRSKLGMEHGVKTSMNVGTLYPVSCVEVLPGDSFKSTVSVVARVTSSFIKPVMDNAFMDVYHFFVPYRLVYSDAEKIFGDPNPSAYLSNTLASVPCTTSTQAIAHGTVWDYLGVPPGYVPKGLNVMPVRAFALIYDKWFRNENVTNEMYIYKGAFNGSENPNPYAWSNSNYSGQLPKVCKKKDYFTASLPKPQKGADVLVPLGARAPVGTMADSHNGLGGYGLTTNYTGGLSISDGNYNVFLHKDYNTGTADGELRVDPTADGTVTPGFTLYPTNLWADLKNATGANVNDVRFAFQLQKMLERDSLYGSRYNEYLLAHFGVSAPDSRLQFPEFLGGGRIPISLQQVAQTSESTAGSPLANVAGYSLSNGQSKFSKGFVEHGYLMTVACIRTLHTYQDGCEKMWYRRDRNDFYDPLFANLGNQPVYLSELFLDPSDNSSTADYRSNVFGYQEAWAEYRYIPNRVTGLMRSPRAGVTKTLDLWHFGDSYASAPTLSTSFVEETPANINRTLSIASGTGSTNIDNFIVDFWFDTKAIRVMPVYSTPGLIDHH